MGIRREHRGAGGGGGERRDRIKTDPSFSRWAHHHLPHWLILDILLGQWTSGVRGKLRKEWQGNILEGRDSLTADDFTVFYSH